MSCCHHGLVRAERTDASAGRCGGVSARLGFADLEPGDGFGGCAGDLGEQLLARSHAEGVVGGFDGDGAAGVDHADVDALSGNDYRPATADSPVDPHRFTYIDGWYNTRRIQKELGYLSPDEYETAWHTTQAEQPETAIVTPTPAGAR